MNTNQRLRLHGLEILVGKYIAESRALDANDYGGMGLISEEKLESMEEEISKMKEVINQNKDIMLEIINSIKASLKDLSDHDMSEYRDGLTDALTRSHGFPQQDNNTADGPASSAVDRITRLQRQHDLIHSMYHSMNPKSKAGDFDVDLVIGGFTFNCQTRILSLQSDYFAQKFKTRSDGRSRKRLKIPSVNPDTFMVLLRYMYLRQFYPISLENLFELTEAAIRLSVKEAVTRCTETFRERKLFVNMVQEWSLIMKSKLEIKINIQELFDNVHFLTSSQCVTLFFVVSNHHLQVEHETEVCDLIVDWLEKHCLSIEQLASDLDGVLLCVRWSAVPEEYVRAKLLTDKNISRVPLVTRFLTELLDLYHAYGLAMPGQLTSIRASLGHEKCFVSVEIDEYDNFNVTMRRFQRPPIQSYLGYMDKNSVEPHDSISGAVYHEFCNGEKSWPRDALYLTGTGKNFKGISKYDISTGWSKCSDMVVDRKHHRSVFVGSKLFSCGGVARCTIEEFDINSNKSKMHNAELLPLTDVACVAYKNSIYFFGGLNEGVCSDRVQRYDTDSGTIHRYDSPMPRALSGLVPVVCSSLIILLHETTCLFFKVSNETWDVREDCKSDHYRFAAAFDDGKIFIFGDANRSTLDQDGGLADVKVLEARSVLASDTHDDAAVWEWRGHLNPPPTNYLAYGTMVVPSQQFREGSWTWISQ